MPSITPLAAGDVAPAFEFVTQDGNAGTSADLAGKPYVLYFYPKDDTPGCTKEACAFRDTYANYEAEGVAVIGISGDSQKSHSKFREKYSLPFHFASDSEDFAIANAYGVYGEKKFMGRVYDGIHRVSFLVGPDGKILKTYPKVKPEQHAAEVIADLKDTYPA